MCRTDVHMMRCWELCCFGGGGGVVAWPGGWPVTIGKTAKGDRGATEDGHKMVPPELNGLFGDVAAMVVMGNELVSHS